MMSHWPWMEDNETGQLKQKSLHGAVGSGIQNLNYAYNIRGWLEKINNPDVTPSPTSMQKLNLGLYYNVVPTGLPSTVKALYNGNISAFAWNSQVQTGTLSPGVFPLSAFPPLHGNLGSRDLQSR